MALRKALSVRFTTLSRSSAPRPLLRPPVPVRGLIAQAAPPRRVALPVGDELMERLMGMNRERVQLVRPDVVSVEEAKKVLRAWEMDGVRTRLRSMPRSRLSYSEFLRICGEAAGVDRGLEIARDLDDSGAVIVLGGVVFLRPDEVARAIERVLPAGGVKVDESEEELKEMEEKKAEMEEKAEGQVRRELWAGLGFVMIQTAAFMRLTFWELTWDVMEPICFFVTSSYFMAAYAFFLRTSREPSFQSFFEARFEAKLNRLMKTHHFDVKRFNQLRRPTS